MKKAILKILDEVNVKFSGLDPNLRTRLHHKQEHMLPQAFHMPAYKLGRWNGKVSFFTQGGGTYYHLLEDILPDIIGAGYEIEIEDNREEYSFAFPEVTETILADKGIVWAEGHEMAGEPIILRDYQVDIIQNLTKELQGVQIAATGAGKTIVTATLSKLVEPYGKSIVIVPNKGLVKQTEKDYKAIGLDVGVYYGDRKEFGHTHTICTWQTLDRIEKEGKKLAEEDKPINYFLQEVVAVICDECFSPDTRIRTDNGWERIDQIKKGDKIINYSEKDCCFKEDIVEDVFINLPKSFGEDLYELEFDNGIIVKVTGNHKVLTNRGWVEVKDLNVEDDIINIYDNI